VLSGLWQLHRYDEVQAELENLSLESFYSGYFRALLSFRETRDLKQLHAAGQELCSRYEEPACGWEIAIANRDYDLALKVLDGSEFPEDRQGLDSTERRRIQTYWLNGELDLLQQGLPRWQELLDTDRDDSGGFKTDRSYFNSALLLAIQGKPDEAEQLIERAEQLPIMDWTSRVVYKHEVCRVLGLIAATQAAVNCIQQGLEDPSLVNPFLEPYLPFYDAVRKQPEFIQMLAEIDGQYPN
jgi:tetratricopeptide (TPR) repeat protein